MKNPLTPAGIEPTTFRFVAQHLNHCATAVPLHNEDPNILRRTVRTTVDMANLGPGICSSLPQTSLLRYFKIYQSFLSLGKCENRSDRTDNDFRAFSRTGFRPVIGHNPGSLLAFLLDIIPSLNGEVRQSIV